SAFSARWSGSIRPSWEKVEVTGSNSFIGAAVADRARYRLVVSGSKAADMRLGGAASKTPSPSGRHFTLEGASSARPGGWVDVRLFSGGAPSVSNPAAHRAVARHLLGGKCPRGAPMSRTQWLTEDYRRRLPARERPGLNSDRTHPRGRAGAAWPPIPSRHRRAVCLERRDVRSWPRHPRLGARGRYWPPCNRPAPCRPFRASRGC